MKRTVEEIWNGLYPANANEVLVQRVDDTHPLDFYLGREITGEPLLILLTDFEPPEYPTGQSVDVRLIRMNDGKWSIIFKLMREELANIFSQLCTRLIETSRRCDKSSGAAFVLTQYLQWMRLLERGRAQILDENSLRGLIGELLILHRMISLYGTSKSIDSWTGPSRADQDFRFEDCWYEVKTVRPGTTAITISSVEQLDLPGYKGQLAIVVLDKTSSSEPGCFTPIDLVKQIKDLLKDDPNAILLFETVLDEIGFFIMDEYLRLHFVLRDIRYFEVTEDFPSITRSNIHPGIKNVKYEIILSSLSHFEV